MGSEAEYVIDGDTLNHMIEEYKLEKHMLPSQVFDIVQKKLVPGLLDEVEKSGLGAVRFSNLEAIASGPHRDFLYAICGGLAEMVDILTKKGLAVTGAIDDPGALPRNLPYRIARASKRQRSSESETSSL